MTQINDTEDIWDEDDPEQEEGTEPNEPIERARFTAQKGIEPLRVDKFLMIRLENATRNKVQQALEEGLILVNDKAVKANYKVKPGDVVVVLIIGARNHWR